MAIVSAGLAYVSSWPRVVVELRGAPRMSVNRTLSRVVCRERNAITWYRCHPIRDDRGELLQQLLGRTSMRFGQFA